MAGKMRCVVSGFVSGMRSAYHGIPEPSWKKRAVVEHAIAVDRLVKHYGPLAAVDGISFSVPQGTIFGLLGRNGAGKTTTLECCIGLKQPTSGSVRVLELDPSRKNDLTKLRRLVGVQLQTVSLPEKATIG